MMMNQLTVPGHVYWKTSQEFCAESVAQLKGKKVLLLMNISGCERLSLANWLNELKRSSTLMWLEQIPSNPTCFDILQALQLCKQALPEAVIAVGGGSIIDIAKSCVAHLYLLQKQSFSYTEIMQSIRSQEYLKYFTTIPIYAVPTTAGTGSEVTPWATVWDKEGRAKQTIVAPWLYPKYAYIVPEFTCSMPPRLTLSTGLDALCQAIESYWAKASNPMVRELSKTAIRLLVVYLPKVLTERDNLFHRQKVCLGSLFAGLAFANTRTTACHALSYPLTICFGVEHGLACAVTLAEVMRLNFPQIPEVEELMAALSVKSPEELQAWLDHLASGIVRLRLSAWGIRQEDIEDLVALAFTKSQMENNPVMLTAADVRKIFTTVW